MHIDISTCLTAIEKVTLVPIENDNYVVSTSYPLIYKNGFLVGSVYVACTAPSSSYVIAANLPEGYSVHGLTFYWQEDEINGNQDIPRIFLHASSKSIGIRGGQTGRNYIGLVMLPCVKS